MLNQYNSFNPSHNILQLELCAILVSKKILTVSDQYHNFNFWEFFYTMAAGGHFGCPKLTFDGISGHFRSIRKKFEDFYKMDAGAHFGLHFWPFQIDTQLYFFWNFWQNGCRWPFWMSEIHFLITFLAISDQYETLKKKKFYKIATGAHFWMSEIHFRWHFWPFQIDTQL